MQEELFRQHPEDNATLAAIERSALLIESAQLQHKTLEEAPENASSINKVTKSSSTALKPKKSFQNEPVRNSPQGQKRTLDPTKTCLRHGREKHHYLFLLKEVCTV